MKNGIRAVMCVLLTCTSAVFTYVALTLVAKAATLENDNLNSEAVIQAVKWERASINNDVFVSENREILVKTIKDPNLTVGSVDLRIGGRWVVTEPVTVDADSLMLAYQCEYAEQDWDVKNKMNIIHTLWNFLVDQNDVDETIAAAIIGTTMYEGRFAEEQGSYRKIESIEEARKLFGAGKCGYGVVQWTYSTRQKGLLNYYELAYELYPDDWDKACIVAECCMLLRELEAYGVFDSLYDHTTIEDAVGRMCLCYEVYEGVHQQWSSEGGFHLISYKGSGVDRLVYSENIYSYFMEGQ